jgi:glutamate-1-semialdehyde 2,1-aminomutase
MGRVSDELLKRAKRLPGLRSGFERSVVASKAQGARVYDADNVGYIDYQGGGGAAIVGFANQFVLDGVRKVLGNGVPDGFHVPQEVDLAETLSGALPWVGNWWMCRTQDEAIWQLLNWARETTGKTGVMMLDGGRRLRITASGGEDGDYPVDEVPGWNLAEIETALQARSDAVAAFVVDPLMTRVGVIPAPEGALADIATICRDAGILLVFDERITGFRIERGGAQSWSGVTPDAAVFGGALGGGFPIGVVGFREGIDEPIQKGEGRMPTPHPVSLAAAEAVLSILKNETIYARLEERTAQLTTGVQALAERFSRPMVVNRVGSVFALYMTGEAVRDCSGVRGIQDQAYWRISEGLRKEGVLLPRQPGGVAFVSSAHGAKDIEETLAAWERVLLRLHQEDLP